MSLGFSEGVAGRFATISIDEDKDISWCFIMRPDGYLLDIKWYKGYKEGKAGERLVPDEVMAQFLKEYDEYMAM